nr:CoA transferase [Lachnospiraceae bacterium]
MDEVRKPLEGITVVELANYVAAPIVGRMCADLGAEVIKIEGRGGDIWRSTCADHTLTDFSENPLFDFCNAGKKSISLNLKDPKGKEVLFRLLENADILITNTRQQSLVKLGIDYESLKDRFPRLIYGTVTGYGYEGPDCNAPGFDMVAFWSRSGFMSDMRIDAANSYPVNSRYAMGDTATGSLLFGSIMTALYQRERTGRGDFVTMSLYNAGIWIMAGGIIMAEKPYCHPFPEKRLFGNAINLVYECADKEWIRCTILDYNKYADKFYNALGVTEQMREFGIHDTVSMTEKAEQVVPIFEKIFRTKTSDEWRAIFDSLDIVNGRLTHFADVLEDEQAWANQYIQKYTCTNGAERILMTNPVRLGSQGALPVGRPLLCGTDTKEVLGSLGYTPVEIEFMAQNGTLL